MITAYAYTNDRVSKIRHNDFSYNITYDAWGNVKSIFIGALDTALTIPFVEYTYGTGTYRSRIQKVAFKNGNTIDYRYDGENVTGITVMTKTTVLSASAMTAAKPTAMYTAMTN